MNESFNTAQEARKHLRKIKKQRIKAIKMMDDKILADNSFVYKDLFGKWRTFLCLWTEGLKKDLENTSSINAVAEIEKAIEEELKKHK